MTKQLSPAAKAVLDAATEAQYGSCYTQFERISSAALRAAADHLGEELEFYDARMIDAEDLLAIADELESQ